MVYADLESFIKKVDGYKNNPEKSCTAKVGEPYSLQILDVYDMDFDGIENNYDVYRGWRLHEFFF